MGVVTPSQVGALYLDLSTDTVHGGGGLYGSIGVTNADWVQLGGPLAVDPDTGLYTSLGLGEQISGDGGFLGFGLWAKTTDGQGIVQISDQDAANGTGNGAFWFTKGADGAQVWQVNVGSTGQFLHLWGVDGSYAFPAALTGSSWGVAPDGAEYKKAISAPADDDVADSQVLDWFDDAVGAPAPRFKAKDSAGTLFVGQLVTLLSGGVLNLPGLPTADPHATGQVWNSAGTLKVSAG